jgi:hypothetical protein
MALASLLILLRVYVESCTLVLGLRKADGSASVAIWNRKKIILALAISVWGTDIAFLIHGKSLPVFPL